MIGFLWMALEEAVGRVIAVECVQTPEIVSKTNKNDNPPPQSKQTNKKKTFSLHSWFRNIIRKEQKKIFF